MMSGLKRYQQDMFFDNLGEETSHEKRQKRRPHATRGKERRYSLVSLGKELVLSQFTNLKMQWTMEAR